LTSTVDRPTTNLSTDRIGRAEAAEPAGLRAADRPAEFPDEPPPGVSADLLWRVAVRLRRDHSALACAHSMPLTYGPWPPGEARERCRDRGQPWPCASRRLAELALDAAAR
jgi:hypothetical protein